MLGIKAGRLFTPVATNVPIEAVDHLSHARATVKTRIASCGTHKRRDFAQAFCGTVLTEYWTRRLADRGCDWRIRTAPNETGLATSERALAKEVVQLLDPLSTHHAGYLIGILYTSLLPPEVRSGLGAYYTPPTLVARLIENVTQMGFNWAKGSVLDPSCGGAAFLGPLAKQIASGLRAQDQTPTAILQAVSERIRGMEIDPFAAWMSMVLLELELLDTCIEAGQRVPNLIAVGDALNVCSGTNELFSKEKGHQFDLVIGNPPYGRVSLTADVRKKYRRSLYGHANLYGLFTDLALRLSAPGAIVAYVTPTSFLGGEYFKRLRALLRKEAPPARIDFVTERTGVFEDVLQETVLVTFKKGAHANEEILVSSLRPNGASLDSHVSFLS